MEPEYSDASIAEVAASRGLVVSLPLTNELQIDIDSAEQFERFKENLDKLTDGNTCGEFLYKMLTVESESGAPNLHVYLLLFAWDGKPYLMGSGQRIALQSVLGSDPMRELLSVRRMFNKVEHPTALFETLATFEGIQRWRAEAAAELTHYLTPQLELELPDA